MLTQGMSLAGACSACVTLPQVRLAPSDILAGALALGLASFELASHHTSFTLNNMVRKLTLLVILLKSYIVVSQHEARPVVMMLGAQPA